MKLRHFLTLEDLSPRELHLLLETAEGFYASRHHGFNNSRDKKRSKSLEGKSIVILLEKPSTRTRTSFEVAVYELGGYPVTLLAQNTQLNRGESLQDTAKTLATYAHLIVFRTFEHKRLEIFRDSLTIPLINALSDDFHPCQLLADLMTIKQEFSHLEGLDIAWIGDGNNMAHSWILASARTGIHLRISTPSNYQPNPDILSKAKTLGANISFFENPLEAASNADVVTTDVWSSIGQELEIDERTKAFQTFQVDKKVMQQAKKEAIFLHCLPAHRGKEVTQDVIDSSSSRIWKQAENRLHTQKALLEMLLLGQ